MTKKILFTSPGRRFELISFFKKEFSGYEFIGADAFKTSPAAYILDRVHEVPLKIDEKYLDDVLEICKKEKPQIVLPLIDPELPLFAKHKKKFNEIGVHVCVPDYEVVKLSNDKYQTFLRFRDTDILQPETWLLKDYLLKAADTNHEKLILKPSAGSASKGIYFASPDEVKSIADTKKLDSDSYIVQQYINFSEEITVDVYGDGQGNVVEYCQRKRISTRGGEVEKGVTVNIPEVADVIKKVVSELKIEGMVNIQVMIEKDKVYLGEINPRFGGGYPLSHTAGANMIQHIKNYVENTPFEKINGIRYKTGFYVLRYDNAVYTDKLLDLI
ncbi:MAG: ATP-grasp domain-containing protein [Bacteroidetes bacterium]|nr:ATP-grasp domain-containing protein [Bacteroidota bacterium]